MLRLFYTDKYDDIPLVKYREKTYTLKEIKSLIGGRIEEVKAESDNIVIIAGDNFSFIINFFAGIFSGKQIYLLTEEQKLKFLDIEYSIPDSNFRNKSVGYKFPDVDLKTTLINVFTSGSTDRPKEIKKSLYNISVEAVETAKDLEVGTDNIIIKTSTTPCHMFGMTYFIGLPFIQRCLIDADTVNYGEDLDVKNCLFVSTPTFLKSLVKHLTKEMTVPQYIISAGAKLDNITFAELKKYSDVSDIYGSSEMGVIAYRKSPEDSFLTLFNNVKITEDNRVITEYGYMSNSVPDDNIQIIDNKIKVMGRKDRLLKIYDKRVSAQQIEKAVISTGLVKESYCFKFGDKLAGVCALTDAGKSFLTHKGIVSLMKYLKREVKVVSDVVPQKWRFTCELPCTSSGKLDKNFIAHWFNLNLSMPVILDKTINNNEAVYKMFFYKNSNFYNGHFPDFPVTPGVVQLCLAGELINYTYKKSCSQGQIKKIKFNNIIKPDTIVNLKLEKCDKSIKYTYYDAELSSVFSSGQFPLYNIFEGEINVPL